MQKAQAKSWERARKTAKKSSRNRKTPKDQAGARGTILGVARPRSRLMAEAVAVEAMRGHPGSGRSRSRGSNNAFVIRLAVALPVE